MKSWADHCSSDEESFNEDTPLETFDDDDDDDVHHNATKEPTVDDAAEQLATTHLDDDKPPVEEAPPARTYNFPSGPPYTLFVGNLSYDIRDGRMLGDALADVVRERLQKDIRVVGSKIPSLQQQQQQQHGDRQQPPRHKGFGYVEVASLEEMKLVLELNMDPGARMAGRKMQLDTAQPKQHQNRGYHNNNNQQSGGSNFNRGSRRASAPEIDGRQFRQGKYNSNDRRSSTNEGPPTTQRPSLILKPRTKPIEETSTTKSDIFGGAKARDGNAWHPSKRPSAPPSTSNPKEEGTNDANVTANKEKDNHNRNAHATDRRTSGRGGRGRGDGRGRGSHGHGTHNKDNQQQQEGGGDDNGNATTNRRGSSHNNSNKGGRGGGRGGRGRHNQQDGHNKGRGGGGHSKDTNKKEHDTKKATTKAPPAAAAPAPAPAAATPPAETAPGPKRVSNTFAALAFDSDSD